jgi:hypothetical protein
MHIFEIIHSILVLYNSTTMDPIDLALSELALYDKPNYSAVSKKFQVDRTTLSRRHRAVTHSAAIEQQNRQLLSPIQERTLIRHLNTLTERGLPPTPAIVRNLAAELAQKEPGSNWSSRFVRRHQNDLTSRYLVPLDSDRFNAESNREFIYWFEGLQHKIEQYSILPENIYNMDEKGFLIGLLTKSRRIFTKAANSTKKEVRNRQDGSREWITVIGTICADGSSLPPALIYQAVTGNLQDSWLQDFDSTKHAAFFASSPTGWTNDELGYRWLETVFDRFTKQKARQGRDWRLLLVDGHGSHINMRFLDYCRKHSILVAVYPPHTTHRLQPLDVGLFSPLATFYSQELD